MWTRASRKAWRGEGGEKSSETHLDDKGDGRGVADDGESGVGFLEKGFGPLEKE